MFLLLFIREGLRLWWGRGCVVWSIVLNGGEGMARRWYSGSIRPCHGRDPGSILGRRTSFRWYVSDPSIQCMWLEIFFWSWVFLNIRPSCNFFDFFLNVKRKFHEQVWKRSILCMCGIASISVCFFSQCNFWLWIQLYWRIFIVCFYKSCESRLLASRIVPLI